MINSALPCLYSIDDPHPYDSIKGLKDGQRGKTDTVAVTAPYI